MNGVSLCEDSRYKDTEAKNSFIIIDRGGLEPRERGADIRMVRLQTIYAQNIKTSNDKTHNTVDQASGAEIITHTLHNKCKSLHLH